ncbi:hypothetical protein [Duganella vulcania]|uniref:Uncharacterized protein n=1 Tax=Duganella vulcania TaxID=2692166 RepID=A0A845GQ49_9BURK|nr:hypothetical protein [Duganella vulcania]MYM96404.1 hypothetical protein [Duganella vulcania]
MAKTKFIFDAAGRKLSSAEQFAVRVFRDKYAVGAVTESDQDAQHKIAAIESKARKALSQGKIFQTQFAVEIKKAGFQGTMLVIRDLDHRPKSGFTATKEGHVGRIGNARSVVQLESEQASKSGPSIVSKRAKAKKAIGKVSRQVAKG